MPEWLVSSMCECVERGCDTGLKCCLNVSSLSPRTRRAPPSPTYTFQNELHHLTPSHTYVSDRGGVSERLMLSICYCVGRGEPLPKIVVSMSSRRYLVLVSLFRAPCVARSLVSFIHPCIHSCIHASMHASMHPCMHPCIHACIHASMHACIIAFVHAWMHAWMHEWMHGCMHGCMHARMYVWMEACMDA